MSLTTLNAQIKDPKSRLGIEVQEITLRKPCRFRHQRFLSA